MGNNKNKKNKNKNNKNKNNKNKNDINTKTCDETEANTDNDNNTQRPLVSICTPTFNRRPFIPYMIKCFEQQDYPKDRMEWIIIDDGTDKIEDLVSNVPQVRYFKYDEKMVLGKKRNLMHSKAKGDIFVYMDDDDYYPPDRVSHAVDTLLANPSALCAGSSSIYVFFKHIEEMYQFGPYGPNHATAGTFAFKKELLLQTSYSETAALAEEKEFLKNYTIPFVQLDPMKTIVVFSHEHNTFDKRNLLEENMGNQFCKKLNKPIEEFVKNKDMVDFYTNRINKLLKDYDPGKPSMKPDVLEQIITIERNRRKQAENAAMSQSTGIVMTNSEGASRNLNKDEIVEIMKRQQEYINVLTNEIKTRDNEIQRLKMITKRVNTENHDNNTENHDNNTNKTNNEAMSSAETDDKDLEIRRLHKVLLKLNEKMLDMESPD
tara:strand:+ start:1908 stop:3203 length:1296 start_codon:yes stop_codon:yes gene_type:complete